MPQKPPSKKNEKSNQEFTTAPRVHARAWLEWHGEPFLGPGRAALLEGVALHGSISRAATDVGVSFRTAWNWIEHMNAAAGHLLVVTTDGGRGGGGARLTSTGEAALHAIGALNAELDGFVRTMDQRVATLFVQTSSGDSV